jgi:hypothetical protein
MPEIPAQLLRWQETMLLSQSPLLAGSGQLAAQHGFPASRWMVALAPSGGRGYGGDGPTVGVRQQCKQASQGFETQISQISQITVQIEYNYSVP